MSTKIDMLSLLPALDWTYEDRNTCQEIVRGVWLGPRSVGKQSSLITELGLTDIVLVRSVHEESMLRPLFPEFRYHVIEMEDNGIFSHQKIYSDFVSKIQSGVWLVIGLTGMNRSASLLAALLMRTHNMSLTAAVDYLATRRRCACISPSLKRQLAEFEIGTIKISDHCSVNRVKRVRDPSSLIR